MRSPRLTGSSVDRTYAWEGNRIGPAHAKDLIEALEAELAEPTEAPDA